MRLIRLLMLVLLVGAFQVSAQQSVDRRSLEAATNQLREKTNVPLRLPTLFVPPSSSTAAQKRKPLSAVVTQASADAFTVEYCFSKVCRGPNYYGVVSAEKIAPGAEKPFGTPVALAREITGYYEEGSCGASCGHGFVSWDQDGYRYSVGLNLDDDEKTLTRFANSAIMNDSLLAGVSGGPTKSDIRAESGQAGYLTPEQFVTATLRGEDELILAAAGDLDGDGLDDWAGVVKRRGEDASDTRQIFVLLRQSDAGYRVAARSQEAPVAGMGCCWVENLEIKRGSIFIQNNAKTAATMEAATHQFKLYRGEWRLIGLKILHVDLNTGISVEKDMNLLTGAVIEKRRKGSGRPAFRRYQKRFEGYYLRDFNFFNGFGAD